MRGLSGGIRLSLGLLLFVFAINAFAAYKHISESEAEAIGADIKETLGREASTIKYLSKLRCNQSNYTEFINNKAKTDRLVKLTGKGCNLKNKER